MQLQGHVSYCQNHDPPLTPGNNDTDASVGARGDTESGKISSVEVGWNKEKNPAYVVDQLDSLLNSLS